MLYNAVLVSAVKRGGSAVCTQTPLLLEHLPPPWHPQVLTEPEPSAHAPQQPPTSCSALVSQSRPTLHDPMDSSPPGSFVHGILWARMLEWVATPFSRGSSRPRDQTQGLLRCRQILYYLSQQGGGYGPERLAQWRGSLVCSDLCSRDGKKGVEKTSL